MNVDALLNKATRIFDAGGPRRAWTSDPNRAASRMMRVSWRRTVDPLNSIVQREVASVFPDGVPMEQDAVAARSDQQTTDQGVLAQRSL